MRDGTARQRCERAEKSAVALLSAPSLLWRSVWFGFCLILLLASRAALAGPAAFDGPERVPTSAEVEGPAPTDLPDPISYEFLLEIPGRSPSEAEMADKLIASAVARGTAADLVRPSAFRKRRSDLLRVERPLEIGDQEMLLRLRLRAKMRRAMSVELRF